MFFLLYPLVPEFPMPVSTFRLSENPLPQSLLI